MTISFLSPTNCSHNISKGEGKQLIVSTYIAKKAQTGQTIDGVNYSCELIIYGSVHQIIWGLAVSVICVI